VTEKGERRSNHAMRRRVDKLIGRVHEARAEIVEKGLEAVHEDPQRGDPPTGDDAKAPPDAGTANPRP
jgi:hypothetical protein